MVKERKGHSFFSFFSRRGSSFSESAQGRLSPFSCSGSRAEGEQKARPLDGCDGAGGEREEQGGNGKRNSHLSFFLRAGSLGGGERSEERRKNETKNLLLSFFPSLFFTSQGVPSRAPGFVIEGHGTDHLCKGVEVHPGHFQSHGGRGRGPREGRGRRGSQCTQRIKGKERARGRRREPFAVRIFSPSCRSRRCRRRPPLSSGATKNACSFTGLPRELWTGGGRRASEEKTSRK